jgi:hypothetical protein
VKIAASLQALINSGKLDAPNLLELMKPGMVLQARVLDTSNANLARLLVGSAILNATTRAPLQSGESLTLRVDKGLPQPELKIMLPLPKPPSPAEALLRSALLRQMTPKEVQQAVRQLGLPPPLAKPGAALAQSLPQMPNKLLSTAVSVATGQPTGASTTAQQAAPDVRAQQVLRVLVPPTTTPQQLDAATVKRALQQSGLFFEPTLAAGSVASDDRKLQLLQLLRLLTPQAGRATDHTAQPKPDQEARPPAADSLMHRLLRLVEGSLARIQSHQVASLPGDDAGRQVWQFELPLQLAERQDHLQLHIERDAEKEGPEGDAPGTWKVDIEFEFDNLGEIFSRINLCGERVSAAFWCQRDSTAKRFEAALPRLEKTLQQAGLEVTAVSSLTGEPPRSVRPSPNLFDDHA